MTKVHYLGPKRRFPQLQDRERRTMHPTSTRFRVHELMISLRRRLKTAVRIEEDHRGELPGGIVTLRLGLSPNSPLVIVRTMPEAASANSGESQAAQPRTERFLVYSASLEYLPEIKTLNRYTVDELVDKLKASCPTRVIEEVITQEDSCAA